MKLLNRPMFRKGGSPSKGTGVMSMVEPRENYALGTSIKNIRDLQSQYEQSIRKASAPSAGEKAALIAQIASTPGNLYEKITATLPTQQKILAQRRSIEPKLLESKIKGELDLAKLEAAATPKAGTTQKNYQFMFNKYKQFRDAGVGSFKGLTDAELSKKALEAASNEYRTKTSPMDALRQLNTTFGPQITVLESRLQEAQGRGDILSYKKIKKQLETTYRFYADQGVDITQPKYQVPEFDPKLVIKKEKRKDGGRIGYASGSKDPKFDPSSPMYEGINKKIVREFIEEGIPMGYDSVDEYFEDFYGPIGMKDGGRIGYAKGTPAEEIVASNVEEKIEAANPVPAGTELKSFSYDELRGRLPLEVSNDIVSLIATSQEALEDFAYITTQSDIGNFNQKYGVNLTLPVSE